MSINEAFETLKGYAKALKRGEVLADEEVANANEIMDEFNVTNREIEWIFAEA